MRIRIDAKKLPGALLRRNAAMATAVQEGLEIGAERSRTWLTHVTPYDEGTLSAAWKIKATQHKIGKRGGKFEALQIFNDMPYAGVIELGARPYVMGRKAITGLMGWAQRKLGLSEKDAKAFAFAYRRRMMTRRRKGTYFVRDSVQEIGDMTMQEIMRRINRLAATKEPR